MCIKYEELREKDLEMIGETDNIGGVMYECKVCKKKELKTAELNNNVKKELESTKLLLKNAEKNEFTIAENIVKIKELRGRNNNKKRIDRGVRRRKKDNWYRYQKNKKGSCGIYKRN